MTDYLVPILLLLVCLAALHKKENAYDLLLTGGADGLKLLISLVPALVLLLTAVTMLRASGAVEIISRFLAPFFQIFGIPPETALLVLIRPISGSAALLMEWGIVRGNDPYLYGEKVKAYLRSGAQPIRGESDYPNNRVGFGGRSWCKCRSVYDCWSCWRKLFS